jgi:cytochrome c-type biogenesis protein CcmE
MTHLKVKLSIAGLILAAAVGYLAYAGMQKGWVYTLSVEQYLASPDKHQQRVRLCGTVAPEALEIRKAQLTASFFVKGQQKQIPVLYKGVVPDMFQAGAEVVVEGKQDATGVFQADTLLTKCASKYEERPKDHPQVGPATAKGGAS